MKRYAIYAAGNCFPILEDLLRSCPNYERIIMGGGVN
jgi:hypothetical protein